jgi:hypothetical protein
MTPASKVGFSAHVVSGVKWFLKYGGIHMSKEVKPAPPGFRWVFCKCFKHWRTGKLVYPRNGGSFMFLVKGK